MRKERLQESNLMAPKSSRHVTGVEGKELEVLQIESYVRRNPNPTSTPEVARH